MIVWLVWAVIPLILIGIIGLQESFADSSDEGITQTKKITTVVQKTVDGKPVIEEYEQEVTYYFQPPTRLDGCEKTLGLIPWNPDSKIMPDLQKEIDAGKENLCVEIVLPFVGKSYSSDPDDLNTVLTNLDTLSKFLVDNGATLEKNRKEHRKYVTTKNVHLGANVPTTLISELVEKEYVVSIDLFGKLPKIPWHITQGYDSKVRIDLQKEIDAGKEIIPIYVHLRTIPMWPYGWPDPSTYPTREQIEQRNKEQDAMAAKMQEPIISLLNDNNVEITRQYLHINSIIANVPVSLISELEKFDDVVIIGPWIEILYSFDNDIISENTSIGDQVNPELILDVILDTDPIQLSISGDAQNLKEIPVPDNVLGKEIHLLVNGVVEKNFEIVSSSSQTLLTLQPILFQDTPIEENLPPISPLKQIKLGISHSKITCKEGLELIFKPSDNSPACVKPSTAEKLIERGWVINKIENTHNQKQLDISTTIPTSKIIELTLASPVEFVDDGREIQRSILQKAPAPEPMYDRIMDSMEDGMSVSSTGVASFTTSQHEKYSVNPGVGFYAEDWMPEYIPDGQKLLYTETICYEKTGDCGLGIHFVPTTFVLHENVTSNDLEISKGFTIGITYSVLPLDEVEDGIEYLKEVFESQPGNFGLGFVEMTRDGKTVHAHEGGNALNHYRAVLAFHPDEHTSVSVRSYYHTLDELIPIFESIMK